ncbi:MAG TPA: hypothetical protein VGV89_00520 [Thermoplasmata archaeon]|nr:hypothetical protein [Thermoplasmata archaeon]
MSVELSSELLSGPDLGGGFLFQLSRDRAPLAEGFTFHVQEAGTDAGEKPAGSPELLGFEHPAEACMYGGPQCWHKRFAVGESSGARVRVAYNRTRFVIAPLLRQAGHIAPAPIEAGLKELLTKIAHPLEVGGVPWQIGGSAGAWIRGVALEPADIDLCVTTEDVHALEELLEEFLIEPNHPVPNESGDEVIRGAAFVGTFQAGIRVEWGAAHEKARHGAAATEWGPGWVFRVQKERWGKFEVPLAPLEFELIRVAQKGEIERLDLLIDRMAEVEPDSPLLAAILPTAQLPPEIEERIRGALPDLGQAN